MEMTFPHSALRQELVNGRADYKALLASVVQRQANSRTVCALRQAERAERPSGNDAERRMHYFAHQDNQEMSASGAFWFVSGMQPKCESTVYQAGSTNIKDHELNHEATGEQLNLGGHGASRTL
jgi:hypothetical protein